MGVEEIWKTMDARANELERFALFALHAKDLKAHDSWSSAAKVQREQMRAMRVRGGWH